MNRIETDQAPKALGPYSQGVMIPVGELIFVSGQLPLDPATGKIVEGDIRTQIARVIKNLQAILEAAGSSLKDVVRTDVFLQDLADFAPMNEEYAKHFEGPVFPARQTIQVAKLPLNAPIEISCIALAKKTK
jgi:2-iminobutanoate/2-iminopropanoate deaminase